MACVNHFCDGVAVGRTWARLPLCSKVSVSCGCARAARTWHRTLCSPATPSSLHVPPSQLSSPCSQIRTCKTTKQGKHSNTHHRRQFYSWGCSFQRRGCDAGSNVESGRANLQLPTYLVLLINFISSPAHKTHVTRRKSTESTQQNCWDESECCYPSYHSPRRWGRWFRRRRRARQGLHPARIQRKGVASVVDSARTDRRYLTRIPPSGDIYGIGLCHRDRPLIYFSEMIDW
jgi:hypothetical protein